MCKIFDKNYNLKYMLLKSIVRRFKGLLILPVCLYYHTTQNACKLDLSKTHLNFVCFSSLCTVFFKTDFFAQKY